MESSELKLKLWSSQFTNLYSILVVHSSGDSVPLSQWSAHTEASGPVSVTRRHKLCNLFHKHVPLEREREKICSIAWNKEHLAAHGSITCRFENWYFISTSTPFPVFMDVVNPPQTKAVTSKLEYHFAKATERRQSQKLSARVSNWTAKKLQLTAIDPVS